MMFGSGLEHFSNLRRVKDAKLVFRALMHHFRVQKFVKHPFLSIGPKMMFGSVSEHVSNLQHVEDAKLVFRARMHYFGVPKL
jgi:hypothetical protein